ncbi:MAG: hypothetical protein PHD74_09655 [Candidatus Krumholzibacteria bacterium]|nr:hypothetical protein [Candidatus Krumholzibacteria bacterium]
MQKIRWKTIIAGFSVLALIPFSRAALAQDHPSARISSLGGDHVSGIIPDLYTDLTVNPAYAQFADRLTINYERRLISGFAPAFPYLSEYSPSSLNYSVDSYMTNEISLYGIRLSSWRAALFVQWRLDQSEFQANDLDLGTASTRLRTYGRSDDGDFGRIDFLAARSIGDSCALGFRFQGCGYYESSSSGDIWVWDNYRDHYYTDLSSEYKTQDAASSSGRRISFDFETGLVRRGEEGSRTELMLQASMHPITYRDQSLYLRIEKGFDATQDLTSYSYEKDTWSDEREGDLWNFGLSMRHTFPTGIRIYTGGAFSTAKYDADWSMVRDNYSWYSPTDEILSGDFDCEGSLRGASFFLKGGKTFGLRSNLDLYLGMHGEFKWSHAEEDPVMLYAEMHHESTDSVSIEQPFSLEYTGTEADVYIPLSIQFRPSGYFTCFSSFTICGEWYKYITDRPMPSAFYYNRPTGSVSSYGAALAVASPQASIYPETTVADLKREWSTSSLVTLGFSFHFRDRFFVDVYSASEIIPSNLYSSMLDVRYVF